MAPSRGTAANDLTQRHSLALFTTLILLIAACAPAAPPSPTVAPPPTQAPAAATAAPAPVAPAPAEPATAASTAAAKMDEYYQRAKASGQMSVVHYGPGPEYQPLVAAFKQKYPDVQAELVSLRGVETFQRLSAEKSSGRHIANVVSGGATSQFSMEQQGFFASWEGPPNAGDYPIVALSSGSTRWPINLNIFGIIVNTNAVPADKVPQTRQDLLDPRFKGKGKLLLEDPRAGGPGTDFFTVAYTDLGQEWLDKLKAQEPTFIRDRDAAPIQIARGEFDIFVPVAINKEIFELERSAPVKMAWLREGGATEVTTAIGVVDNAPGQDVAKLWVSWWTSPEGQIVVSQQTQIYAALRGTPPPPGWPTIEEIKPGRRTADQISRNAEYSAVFDETFFK